MVACVGDLSGIAADNYFIVLYIHILIFKQQ